MLTTVKVQCVDQALMVNAPRLASGGVNEIRLEVSFCPLWENMAKTAVFYTDPVKTYHVPMNGDACIIPTEVTDTPGVVYFGFFGVEGETIRTSELAHISLKQGISIGGGKPTEPPKPDIYTQLLAQVTEAKKAAAASAATAKETEQLVEGRLPIGGGEMEGSICMNRFSVTDLADPQDPLDAVSLKYVQKHFAPRGYYEAKFVYVVSYGLDDILSTQMEEMNPGELRVVHLTMDESEVFPGTDSGKSAVCTLYKSPESDDQSSSGWADFVVYSADAEPARLYKRLDTNVWSDIKPMCSGLIREFRAAPGTNSYTTPGWAAKCYVLTLDYGSGGYSTFTADWLGLKAMGAQNPAGSGAIYYVPARYQGDNGGTYLHQLQVVVNSNNTVTFRANEGVIAHIVGYY